MKNSSIGYHTFCIFKNVADSKTLKRIYSKFEKYKKKNSDMISFPLMDKNNNKIGWEFCYQKNKGIRWILFNYSVGCQLPCRQIQAIINPKAFLEKEYIQAARESDLDLVKIAFDQEAAKISLSLLSSFSDYTLKRIDFCINIDLNELEIPCNSEDMMKLIRQGNIPKDFHELMEYDKKNHRKTPYKNSFYLQSSSVTINYYNKYSQQQEGHPNYPNKASSRNVIRFEVQYKYPKLYPIAREEKQKLYKSIQNSTYTSIHRSSIPTDLIITDEISERVTQKYFFKIIRKGDYFSYDIARKIVKSYQFKKKKETRILNTLELVKDHGGIAKAKAHLNNLELDNFKRSLKDLDDIMVNPVTIPRRWNIPHIPNLLRAYYESPDDEVLITEEEYMARKKIEAVLSYV